MREKSLAESKFVFYLVKEAVISTHGKVMKCMSSAVHFYIRFYVLGLMFQRGEFGGWLVTTQLAHILRAIAQSPVVTDLNVIVSIPEAKI